MVVFNELFCNCCDIIWNFDKFSNLIIFLKQVYKKTRENQKSIETLYVHLRINTK